MDSPNGLCQIPWARCFSVAVAATARCFVRVIEADSDPRVA